ncbi:hypothetical protein GGR42_001215 [Saonia flava]|uniref:Uncharacterized protein n=1 Tax=Saonia flava TaxID=523696 RepID=A0A846QWW2_9FLAO|nr:DUF6747 family protein [Saonia flava]NJB70753.1 hypothetical protein [Saonia flava]
MGTLLNFRNLYVDSFNECKPGFAVTILKAYSVFCGILLAMAVYAFMYRVITGFDF